MNGTWLVVEGPNGAGKTTVCDALENLLKGLQLDYLRVRDPGSTALSEQLRTILKDKSFPLAPRTEVALFMAARLQLLAEVILPALRAGKVVICDRWIPSTICYQSRGVISEAIKVFSICDSMLDFEQHPSRIGILKVPTSVLVQRQLEQGGQDRFEALGPEVLDKINFLYNNYVPYRSTMWLDGLRTPAEIAIQFVTSLSERHEIVRRLKSNQDSKAIVGGEPAAAFS